MMHEPDAVNVWAPEIFYDDENKEYIIVWATTIPFRFAKGQEEENNNHRLYYTKTKDFKTFTPAANSALGSTTAEGCINTGQVKPASARR